MWLRGWLGLVVGVGIGARKLGCSLRAGVQILGLSVVGDSEHRLLSSPAPLLSTSHSLTAQDSTKPYNPRTPANHL